MSRPTDPPVKCGYCGWLIGGCENILSHKCLERYDEENDFLNVDDNFVVTLISRQREDTMPAQDTVAEDSTEIDEKLIQAVRDRPALYDFKIPVKERTKLKKDGLWFEISNVLGGVMSSEAAKKRWQYLRDCFNKSKKKLTKYKPSGSAVEVATDRVSFRFYEQMCFLCDSSPSVATVGNVQLRAKSGDGGCSSSAMHTHVDTETSSQIDLTDHESLTSPHPLPKNQTPAAKRQKMLDDKNSELRSALVTALQEPTRPIDSIDGFLARLGEGLRRIPYRQRSQLEIKFLSMLMEVEDDLQL